MKEKKVYTTDENGFYTNYTAEDTLRAKQELKESGTCPVTNPEFYELWKWDDPNKVDDEETKRLKRERYLKVREQVRNDLYKHRR
jgi:hypothetical protein